MGCAYSVEFVVNEEVSGQDSNALSLLQQLHLTKKDIDILFTAFCDMDADSSHYIRRDEFCAYFKLEKTPITVKLVKLMDTDHHGYLNFCEMVGLLWDFLSRDPHNLGSFVFHLFDQSRTGYLSKEEAKDMIEQLHHASADNHKGVKKIIDNLHHHMGDKIDVEELHEFCKKHDEVCLSLYGLQNTLRECLLGKHYWEKLMEKRNNDKEQLKPDYIQQLFSTMKPKRQKKKANADAHNIAEKHLKPETVDDQEKRRSSIMYHFFAKDKKPRPSTLVPEKQRPPRRNSLGIIAPQLIHKNPRKKTHKKNHKVEPKVHPEKSHGKRRNE